MKRLVLLLALTFLAGSSAASEAVTARAGVATSSRFATQAAIAVLRDGGTAVDAATAAAFVLAVARPDVAGIGGGGFLIYYDKAEGATWTVDFREAASWTLVTPDDKPFAPDGVAAAGLPGFVAGLNAAHQRFGRTEWKDLLRPAIFLAEEGYDVDLPLVISFNTVIAADSLSAEARKVLIGDAPTGMAPKRIVQTDLAATLEKIARSPDEMYGGATATKIAEFVEQNRGSLSIRDFREYQPVWRAPLQIDLGTHIIQTAPPPARGGVAVASMLAILGAYELADADLSAPASIHLLAEAQRRATIDAKASVADPSYTRLAIGSILSAARAEHWRSTILPDRATSTPTVVERSAASPDHTTHISIFDSEGNVASLTISLTGTFGSGVMVPGTGVLLNAALKDFSEKAGANEPEPRKRPSTPSAPLILFEGGRPILAAGSSGGDAIPACLTGMLIRLTKKNASLREAVEAPRQHQPDYPDRVVLEPGLADAAEKLESMGHSTLKAQSIGEINAVMLVGDQLISVSDPRWKGSSGGF